MANEATITTACTIITSSELPAATVLANSYLQHHPREKFVIAVMDKELANSLSGDITIVGPNDFGIPAELYWRFATAFAADELRIALIPFLLRTLLTTTKVATYFDRSTKVFSAYPELTELTQQHSAVVLPRLSIPLPLDNKEPREADLANAGVLSQHFLSVGHSAKPLLDYLTSRAELDAMRGDQPRSRWFDEIIALFPHKILRDSGYGCGYWNLSSQRITRDTTKTVFINEIPLRTFIFSGFDPDIPWLLTTDCLENPRLLLSEHPALYELCTEYQTELIKAGYQSSANPHSYCDVLADGTPLTPLVRELFRAKWGEAIRGQQAHAVTARATRRLTPVPPPAFGADQGAAFQEWLASPDNPTQLQAGLNRWVMAIWDSRVDLRVAFPRPASVDKEAFQHWCRSVAPTEHDLAEWAMPKLLPDPAKPLQAFGVNLLGHLTAELGVGELGRALTKALTATDIPTVTVVEDFLVNNRTGLSTPKNVGKPNYPISVLCINADTTTLAIDLYPELFHQRYRIGVWSWELAEFPQSMHPSYELVDEIWTISEFCRAAIAQHTTKPVKVFPIPITDPGQRRLRRDPDNPVQFLFAFDFNSIAERKNPWGLIEAFRSAFNAQDHVRLVIKAINSDLHPLAAERLRILIGADPRISFIDCYISAAELAKLYDDSDCYISLHRCEGFGFTIAEAMARGLPVISTDYSGSAELLDKKTGWPVPYALVPVGDGHEPYPADSYWAEPNLVEAASIMRKVAGNPQYAAKVGLAGREYILRTRTVSAAANWIYHQLEQVYQVRQRRGFV